MKKRLLALYDYWRHEGYPKARVQFRERLKRVNRNVDETAGCAFICLIVLALAAGIVWAAGRFTHAAKHAATPVVVMATPASKMSKPAAQGPMLASTPEPALPPLITNEAEGRRAALRLYPDLGVANTPLNTEFVARYWRYQHERPAFFRDPAWPVILARECAAALGQRAPPQDVR